MDNVVLILCITFLIVLFWGNPDIHDALIIHVADCGGEYGRWIGK